jgi:TolA-binding protein
MKMSGLRNGSFVVLALCASIAGVVRAQDLTPPAAGPPAGEPPFVAPTTAAAPATAAPPTTAVPPTTSGPVAPSLSAYLNALAARRLLAAESGSDIQLHRVVEHAEDLYLDGRYDEASLELYDIVESPRFSDFSELPEYRAAEYMLAGALQKLGAMRTAMHYLERILTHGTEDSYFGPAYRRATDIALESGDVDGTIARLGALGAELAETDLPEDAQNELRYLRGRSAYDRDALEEAETALSSITEHSRFYASAQYLRGAIASRRGELDEAEDLFCSITGTADRTPTTFLVDWRYFEIKDLARLALGRVAHEGRRTDDAFYYYFQVPSDSSHVAEALFESAYSAYEGGDYDTAVDLLDQLQARFPSSAQSDEAAILRGYIHLGRCEFEDADQLFVRFNTRFEPVVHELNAILENPARQTRIYEDLLAEGRASDRGEGAATSSDTSTRTTLLALLQVDPRFYRLNANIRTLDAESARAGRVAVELAALATRVHGGDEVRAADAATDDALDEGAELARNISDARAILAALTEQIDAMRAAGADREALAPLETDVRRVSERLADLEGRAQTAIAASAIASATTTTATPTEELEALLATDTAAARLLPGRVAAVRAGLVAAANDAALRAVRQLHDRLAGEVRRARIGRIDAVMGSKRRIEIQIESLAAGRFPPELIDPLRIQGLLRDDEEYWPFEGEYWHDEYLNDTGDEDEAE